jgi:hypothetical protein
LFYDVLLRTPLYADTYNHQQVAEETEIRAINNSGVAENIGIKMFWSASRAASHDEPDKYHQGSNAHNDEIDLS